MSDVFRNLLFIIAATSLTVAGTAESTDTRMIRAEKTAAHAQTEKQKPNVDKILKDVGCRYGIDWKHLKAICTIESNCKPTAVGDKGKALGAFQIHIGHNPNVTPEQAFDFAWSAEWTAKRLVNHGYREQLISRSIAKHNGSWENPKVQRYVKKVKRVYNKEQLKEQKINST